MEVGQYKIVIVNLDPSMGSEIKKTRPCLILSPDEMNKNLQTVVVAPMTTSKNLYPCREGIMFQGKKGSIALDQIRTIDRKRIVKIVGKCTEKEKEQVKQMMQTIYVL